MLYPLSYGRLAGPESNGSARGTPPEGHQRLRTFSAQPMLPSAPIREPEPSTLQPDQVAKG